MDNVRYPHRLVSGLALALLGASILGCGDSSHGKLSQSHAVSAPTSTARTIATTSATTDSDHDNDNNNDDFAYAQAVSVSETQAVVTLLTRYYAAAARADGLAACALLNPLLREELPALYGTPSSSLSLRGHTCATIMSKLFKLHHHQLVGDHATLEVKAVRMNGRRGLAMISFKTMPERAIWLRREEGTWKVAELLDNEQR